MNPIGVRLRKMSRKKAETWYIDYLKAIDPKSHNVQMYVDFFKKLTNDQFEKLVVGVEAGTTILPYYKQTMYGKPLDLDHIMKIGEKMLGIKFHEKIWMTDPVTGLRTLTPFTYLILDGPGRRQKQHMAKGKALIKNSNKIDNTTGALPKSEKAASISLPEITNLSSMGREDALREFLKANGGDVEARRMAKDDMIKTGNFSLDKIDELGSNPVSSETAGSYFFSLLYENNFKE